MDEHLCGSEGYQTDKDLHGRRRNEARAGIAGYSAGVRRESDRQMSQESLTGGITASRSEGLSIRWIPTCRNF